MNKNVTRPLVWEAWVENSAYYYEDLLSSASVDIPKKGTLVAPAAFRPIKDHHGRDNNHFPMNPYYLEIGIRGIADKARENAKGKQGEPKLLLESVARTYYASADYMARFADEAEKQARIAESPEDQKRLMGIAERCRSLSVRAPRTFHEAVQLFLFCWRIRSHKGMSVLGRLDQHLIKFYKKDIEDGTLTEEVALDIIVELWRCINTYGSGETLMNLMVGGVDADGNDATNALSYIMMRALLITRTTDPQLNCRIHKNTPPEFFDLMVELQLLGHGKATMFNDDVIIPELVKNGFTLIQARNYCNDGCGEIIIDGDSTIDFFSMEAVKAMELTIFEGKENLSSPIASGHYWTKNKNARAISSKAILGHSSGSMSEIRSFEEFYAAYLDQYRFQILGRMELTAEGLASAARAQVTSLFLLGTYPCFLESGKDIYSSGEVANIYQVFLGSVPTVADCLAAVKKVVFEDKACTLLELREAMRADFVGYEELRARLLAAPKFGNDDDEVDLISARLSNDMFDIVEEFNANSDIKFLPGLYEHLFNDFAKYVGSTPDGRRYGDPLCPHYSPTPGRAKKGPTAIIRSAAKTDVARGIAASPLYLSLSRDSLKGAHDNGASILTSLLKASIEMRLQIVNIAIYDLDALRAAQENPEGYEDIMVRVWGFSARFVDLSRDMQDHVIARIIKEGQ